MLRYLFVTCMALHTLALLAACGEENEKQANPTSVEVATSTPEPVEVKYPPPGIEKVVLEMHDYNPFIGDSLPQLTDFFDTIVVGRPVSVETGFPFADFFNRHLGAATCRAEPKCVPADADPSRAGPLVSTYRVEVVEVVKSEKLRAGDVIPLRQSGGVLDGVLREFTADPAIEIGPTYLMFIDLARDGFYGGSPMGRYELDSADVLHNVDPVYWLDLPGVRALEGVPLTQAIFQIEAVLADSQSSAEAAVNP
jgi:hypothetical protein